MEKKVVLVGLGHIGRALAGMSQKHHLILSDLNYIRQDRVYNELREKANISIIPRGLDLKNFLKSNRVDALVSAVPHSATLGIAQLAIENDIHYLDMTEDVQATKWIQSRLASQTNPRKSLFCPNNGVAPGLVSLLARDAMKQLQKKIPVAKWEELILRVGALPIHTSKNPLQYASTWSFQGCVNQYINKCVCVKNGNVQMIDPLSHYGRIRIDGQEYEEFATSGGVGSLCHSLSYEVPNIMYKTLRYPDHHRYMSFLLDDLQFNKHPEELVKILERSLPIIDQDKVIIHVTVKASSNHNYDGTHELVLSKTIYPTIFNQTKYSAIEVATASSTLAVLELILQGWEGQKIKSGFLRVEDIPYDIFMQTLAAKTFLSHTQE